VVIALLVAVCGGIGAVARFGVDAAVQAQVKGSFPLGTLIVNLSGAFLLGLLLGVRASHDVYLVLGTALSGAYTTFSTWMLEAHRAAQDGSVRVAWRSVAIALVLGVACAWLGRAIGRAL
jgi:CrcB protein